MIVWAVLAVSVIKFAICDTVHYTNSPRHLSSVVENYTTYKLQVPGSEPITVIEAAADASSEVPPGILGDLKRRDWIKDEESLQRRKNSKAETFTAKGNLDETGNDLKSSKSRTTVYSPDLLQKFLIDYADRIKNSNQETRNKLQEMILIANQDNEDFEDPNHYNNSKIHEIFDDDREEKYGNSYNDNRRPQNDRYQPPMKDDRPSNGWVTMDVIPWSTSKVSKWQSNIEKYPQHPYENMPRPGYNSEEIDDPYDNDKRGQFNRPSSHINNYDHYSSFENVKLKPYPYEKPLKQPYGSDGYRKPDQEPPYRRPEQEPLYYDYKKPSNPTGINRPNEFDKYQDREPYQKPYKDDRHHYRPWNSEIIADNRPSDFPAFSQISTSNIRRPLNDYYHDDRVQTDRYTSFDKNHPDSYPGTGKGEWVLVSTTKGYHFPRHGQRAMAFHPPTFNHHKSVQLTVLPAESQQMTTFSTDIQGEPVKKGVVEVLASSNSTKVKKGKSKKKVLKGMIPIKANSPHQDSSAVLAAVGAGMVPATMAMLMPMVLGRRKRDLRDQEKKKNTATPKNDAVLTHFSNLDYEKKLSGDLVVLQIDNGTILSPSTQHSNYRHL